MDAPEVRYAKSGNVSIAYAVVGGGSFDLVFGAAFSTLDYAWRGHRQTSSAGSLRFRG